MASAGLLDVAKRVARSGEPHQQRNVAATGEHVMGRVVDVTLVPIGDGAVAFTFVDVTDAHASEERLRQMAERDHLTGLWNRSRFRAELAGNISRRIPSVVAVLDLDGFKLLNDTMGHAVGDLLLQLLGDRFTSQLPEPWTVARLGGDEFAVLAPATDAGTVVERVRSAVAPPLQFEGLRITPEVTIGLASYPSDSANEADLLRMADVALQTAKSRGLSEWACTEAERDHADRRGRLSHSLDLGFAQGQFQMYAQPLVELASYQIVGAEGLARWVMPGTGVLTPNHFLDLLAMSGRSTDLTDHMVTRAAALSAGGRTMSINLSPADLHRPDLVEMVGGIISGLPQGSGELWLEIIEARVMAAGRQTIDELIESGVQVAIDDFGAAFSSLTRLADHDISILKLDRQLLNSLGSNARARRVVRSVVDASHDLGAKVVAEGVETMEACSIVEDLGCDLVQGFLLGRPAPEALVAELLLDNGRVTPDDWPSVDEIRTWEDEVAQA